MKYLLIFVLCFSLFGCSALNETLGLARDLGVTFNTEEAKEDKPLDSVTISFKPAYWQEEINSNSYEQDIYLNGYHIWILQTDSTRRIEVIRQDTTLKFYRK